MSARRTELAIEALRAIPACSVPAELPTPALMLDIDVLRENIARMARLTAHKGVALRPHVKTHKSVAVARMQAAAGVVGFTAGTLHEAEVFAGAGFDDIFLAVTLIASPDKAARIAALHDAMTLRVGVDSVAGAELLAGVPTRSGHPLEVLVEVDSGEHRTGVRPSEAGALAAEAQRLGLAVAGVFTHGGHGYESPDAREPAGRDEVDALEAAVTSMTRSGIPPRIVSAGSTPTVDFSSRGPVTEERPGTYPFNDAGQVALGSCPAAGVAVRVAATVMSTAVPGQYVIDAGTKAIAREPADYLPGFGWLPDHPDSVLHIVNDYHGYVHRGLSGGPEVGERLAVVPNHICPVVNLYDEFHIVQNGSVIDVWPVDARGLR
jgi:D-serine deaminase-like pyridoxal phosphate-dependent protein